MEIHMTLCPVAIAVGCRKCPIFSVCPAKSLIGDQKKDDPETGNGSRSATRKKNPGKH
jgi:hypothetical protein